MVCTLPVNRRMFLFCAPNTIGSCVFTVLVTDAAHAERGDWFVLITREPKSVPLLCTYHQYEAVLFTVLVMDAELEDLIII